MLTVHDFDVAELEAEAAIQDWEAEYQRLFMAPVIQSHVMQAFLSAPQAGNEKLRGLAKRLQSNLKRKPAMPGGR